MSRFIEIKTSRKMGRGLYAKRAIKSGELIEASPVVEIFRYTKIDHMTLNMYVFDWFGGHRALALGLGSLFNHSPRANVTYSPNRTRKEIFFVAARDIRKGEQLFIDYGYDPVKGIEETDRNLYYHLKEKFEPLLRAADILDIKVKSLEAANVRSE